MRILYVEDNLPNLILVQRVARMGKHEVFNYSDGQSVLDNFERDKPDLMLVDILLPGKLNGLDVVKALRDAGHKTPIVALTAQAMMGDRERCLEAGCDAYIPKPMVVDKLLDVFKRYDRGERVTPTGEIAENNRPAAETKPAGGAPSAPES